MKKHIPTIIFSFIFFLGLAIFLYPTVSNLYNEYRNNKLIRNYTEQTEELDEDVSQQVEEEAKLYNDNVYSPEVLEELDLRYEELLNPYNNGIMGYIEIPKINQTLIIYHTTEDDVLQKGVGHVEGTSLPIGGESTHCALAAHRGLPSAKLFSDADYMEIGDVFYIHVLNKVLEYRVDSVVVVEPEAISNLEIENGKDLMTLVTCTPYGVNSHRLLVRGSRIADGETYVASVANVRNELFHVDIMYVMPIALVVLVIGAVVFNKFRNHNRKKRKGLL